MQNMHKIIQSHSRRGVIYIKLFRTLETDTLTDKYEIGIRNEILHINVRETLQ